MVQIIPAAKTFASQLGLNLGGGVTKGFSESLQGQREERLMQLKEMTPLKKAQQELAEAKVGQIKSQQSFFDQISGTGESKPAPFFVSAEEEPVEGSEQVPQEVKSKLGQIPEDKLEQLAAFEGQPGPQGIIGNMAKNELKKKQESEKLDYQSFRDNKEYTEKVLTGYEAYKRDQQVLDQMDQLAKKGKMIGPIGNSIMQKLGLPIGILNNPDSEQFDKLSQELMKNITGTYGSRILQTEVVSFMKSIPTLMNSPEGQKRLIKQWKILNEGKKVYYDAYKNVRKENKNRLPPDLHEKVIDKADEKLDKIGDDFRKMNTFMSVKGPDGKTYSVPEDQLEEALEQGGELI